MRAERLITMLMLLQSHNLMTADQLAAELGVSPRTVYRDIDALSLMGIPVYGDSGPGGGYSLLGEYRGNLTGLRDEELRAFFMLTITDPLSVLGAANPMKDLVLKVRASNPARYRTHEEFVRKRLHLDANAWFSNDTGQSNLETLRFAVWNDRCISFEYKRHGQTSRRTCAPYSLVAKSGRWYAVCETSHGSFRVFRASRMENVDALDEVFERSDSFNLTGFWSSWVQSYEQSRPSYSVTLEVSPDTVPELPFILGEQTWPALRAGTKTPDGWTRLECTFERFEEARGRIMGMGGKVRVLEPKILADSIRDQALAIIALDDGGFPRESSTIS